MDPRPGRHDEDQRYLVRARSIRHTDLHGIEMTAHIGGVDMRHRHVETRARPTHLLRRGHDGLRIPEDLAHGVAARHVPERPMLELPGSADDCALAVALDG